jgi:hypothetical protein
MSVLMDLGYVITKVKSVIAAECFRPGEMGSVGGLGPLLECRSMLRRVALAADLGERL